MTTPSLTDPVSTTRVDPNSKRLDNRWQPHPAGREWNGGCGSCSAPCGRLGLIVYPSKNQDRNQQSQDEIQCYAWVQQQTGVDPMTLTADPNTAAATQQQASAASQGTAGKSTAKVAVAGTAIGAFASDTGKGAAIGATAGAMRGVSKKAAAEKQAAQKGQQAAQAEAQAKMDTFKRAVTACLTGRGYAVD